MAEPSVVTCPNCGAVATEAVPDARCRFCKAVLVTPPRESPAPARVIAVQSGGGVARLAIAAAALCGVVGIWALARSSEPAPAPTAPTITAQPVATAPSASASAAPPPDMGGTLLRRFGTKGGGPGQFKSIGLIAVDPNENVFVTDANPSRVQQLDKDGKFVRLFPLSTEFDCCIHGLAVDHSGHLYVSFHDAILRFNTSDGSALRPLDPPPPHGLNGQGFEAVAVDAFDMVYGLSLGGDGDVGTVMKYDKNGKSVGRFPRTAPKGVGTMRGDHLAFDGAGTIFFSHRGGTIEVLDSKWALQNRIGQEGSGPGELSHFGALAIAPDDHGHLLALRDDRIEVFDTGGRYRRSVLDSKISNDRLQYFALGPQGRLYATTDKNDVAVFELKLGLEDR